MLGNKYRLLALARKGWYSPGAEDIADTPSDSINTFMMQNESSRQLANGAGPSYDDYKVGGTRRPGAKKGLRTYTRARDFYRSSGDM